MLGNRSSSNTGEATHLRRACYRIALYLQPRVPHPGLSHDNTAEPPAVNGQRARCALIPPWSNARVWQSEHPSIRHTDMILLLVHLGERFSHPSSLPSNQERSPRSSNGNSVVGFYNRARNPRCTRFLQHGAGLGAKSVQGV